MRTCAPALVVAGALFSLPVGVALAHKMGHKSAHRVTTAYKGSDSVGVVTFALHSLRISPIGAAKPVDITRFHFANMCSAAGTTVSATITLGPKHGFGYHAHGVTIKGSLSGTGYAHASGTARVTTSACDSGVLTFTATKA